MITILNREVMIKAYRIMLRNTLTSSISDEEILDISLRDYSLPLGNFDLLVTARGSKADSSRYMLRYLTIQRHVNQIRLGLLESKRNLINVFEGYKNSLNRYFELQKDLDSSLYTGIKKQREYSAFNKRYNNFSEKDLSTIDSLKHPKLIDYYFDRNSVCSTNSGAISLPLLSGRKVNLRNVVVEKRFSTFGKSIQPVNNLRTEATSHEYICKVSKALPGAKLTYCLSFNTACVFNKIEILDASIHEAKLTRIFVFDDNNALVDLDYQEIKTALKKVYLINDSDSTQEYKKVYLEFTQNKYIDVAKDEFSFRKRIVDASNSSFVLNETLVNSYVYQFNIDQIQVYNERFKKRGVFRLNKKIDLKNINNLKLKLNGFFLNRLQNTLCFLEGVDYKGNKSIEEIATLQNIDVSKYSEAELFFILESKDTVNSGYLSSIDIRGV